MTAALAYVGGSLAVLLLLTVVYVIEDARGQRVFLVRVRERFDALLLLFLQQLLKISTFFTHGFMRLLLHYGAHTVLKRLLGALRRLEKRVEDLVRKNRKVAKDIHAAKAKNAHFDAIAEHKEEVALNEVEKEERRSR